MAQETGIYAIVNSVTGRKYIGSSINIQNRFRQHRSDLKNGKHKNPILQAAWDRYGHEAFSFIVLELVHADHLLERERIIIQQTTDRYNVCMDPEHHRLNVPHTVEARIKISNAKKGKKMSQVHRQAHLNAMRSAATRAKCSLAKSGSKQTQASNLKRSLSMKNLPDIEQRRERCRMLGLSRKGKKLVHTQEHKRKISTAMKILWTKKRAL